MEREKCCSDLLYADLSYEIIGVAMEVHNSLGPGWNEVDYHNAMIDGLKRRGLEVHVLNLICW
jgi:GxxExxY protein